MYKSKAQSKKKKVLFFLKNAIFKAKKETSPQLQIRIEDN